MAVISTQSCRTLDQLRTLVNPLGSDEASGGDCTTSIEDGKSEQEHWTGKDVHSERLSLENLPDETIAQIFEEIDYDVYSLTKFSHLSARIRQVIQHTPTLWARIPLYNRLRAGAVDHIARLSGACGLTAVIELENVYPSDKSRYAARCTLLDEVFRHCQRWLYVEFNIYHLWSGYIEEHFAHACLSSLRTLVIKDVQHGLVLGSFYRSWSMPRLHDLRCVSFVPRKLGTQTLTMLTKCSFDKVGFQPSAVLRFLSSTPNLTSLSLDIDVGEIGADHGPEVHKVHLPLLKSLEYKRNYYSASVPKRPFSHWVACPNLAHLSYISDINFDGTKSFFNFSAYIKSAYPKLKSFELTSDSPKKRCGGETKVAFEDVIHSLPVSIETVKLNILTASLCSSRVPNSEGASFPNLKVLDIASCTFILEVDFYPNLAKCLRRLGVTLQHFRPSRHLREEETTNTDVIGDALATLRQGGVLV